MAWTDEQLSAMQKNSGNLLVAAGAGSGKTAVLIERIMGIITDLEQPVDVDCLLVLTYTNAAAAEMRQRLTQALRERLAEQLAANEASAAEHITRQLVLLQRAKIMTIHAFCLDLLREYGYALDLDAKSHIGSEGELNLLREKVLDEVFEAAYADANSGLRLLLAHYSRGLGDDNIKALVLRLTEFGQSMPDIEGWLAGLAAAYQQGQTEKWLAYFADCLQDELAELLAVYQAAESLAEKAGLAAYLPLLAAEAEGLRRAAAAGEPAACLQILAQLEFKRLPAIRAKDNLNPEAKERVQLLRKQAKDGVAALLAEAAPVRLGSLAAELQDLAPLATALVNLTLDFHHAWQQAKRRRRLLEFADLEHYALDLLHNEQLGVAASLQQRFFEILVDEYQDINEVQESLLTLLSNGSNRFMVGDIKQSIYRFRLAEPGLFLRRFAAYGRGEGGRRVDLNRNFRSQSAILAGVNFVFARLLRGGNLEIDYDEAAMLHCGRPELPALPVELLIVDKAEVQNAANLYGQTDNLMAGDTYNKEEADNEADNADNAGAAALSGWLADMKTAELEAHVLAQKIQQEHAQGRPWQDMVILLRAVRAWAPVFSRVLRSYDIPCQTDGFDDFLSLPEVQVVCSLLAVLDNPRQDIALAAVLHSPLVGLGLAELADLHILNANSLYEGMCQSHDGRLLQFGRDLAEWRRRSQELGVAELLEYLYNATALSELLGLLPGGGLRRRNLRELQRLAGEYDAAGGVGLGRFLKFLAAGRQQSAAVQTGAAAVRLMTIHKSKGLEFPVVFVAGLGTAFNEEDFRRDILLHRNLGLGMRRVDLVGRRKYPTFGFNIIARKTRWESLAELLRLLYVAMTRAEQKLYLLGTVTSASALMQTLATLPDNADAVPTGFLAKHRSFLPWLCAALLRQPDCQLLRDFAGYKYRLAANLPDADGHWHLELISSLNAVNEQAKAAAAGFDFASWLEAGAAENEQEPEIAAALTRPYVAAGLAKLPVKWSVTAFKRLLPLPENDEEAEAVWQTQTAAAEFAGDLSAEAADRPGGRQTLEWYAAYGRLVHELLQKADLHILGRLAAGGDKSKPEIVAYLQGLLAELNAGCEDLALNRAVSRQPAVLADFFLHPLGRRMLAAYQQNAGQVLREQRFIAGMSLADLAELGVDLAGVLELQPDAAADVAGTAGETVFLQGVIDLAFAEPDGWVLVDYKSGGNRNKSAEQVREEYGLQLAVYRRALLWAGGRPVKEGYVYFTANNRVVRLF